MPVKIDSKVCPTPIENLTLEAPGMMGVFLVARNRSSCADHRICGKPTPNGQVQFGWDSAPHAFNVSVEEAEEFFQAGLKLCADVRREAAERAKK